MLIILLLQFSKNAPPEEFAEFILPENHQELELALVAIETGESTLDRGTKKIFDLAKKVCNVDKFADKILQTLTKQICIRTKHNSFPVVLCNF
jgi:hypothetical protein